VCIVYVVRVWTIVRPRLVLDVLHSPYFGTSYIPHFHLIPKRERINHKTNKTQNQHREIRSWQRCKFCLWFGSVNIAIRNIQRNKRQTIQDTTLHLNGEILDHRTHTTLKSRWGLVFAFWENARGELRSVWLFPSVRPICWGCQPRCGGNRCVSTS